VARSGRDYARFSSERRRGKGAPRQTAPARTHWRSEGRRSGTRSEGRVSPVHSANEGTGIKAHVRNRSHKDGPMRGGATSGREAGAISGHIPSDLPVVIFEVDAAGIDRRAAPARRWDVRLVGSTGGDP